MKTTGRSMVRWAALPVAVGAALFVAWRVRTAPVDVSAHVVDRGPVAREAYGTGLLESETTVDLGFDLPGRVVSLTVDEGDRVHAGQLLGTIDASDLEHELTLAESNRRLAEQTVARSAVDVERAKAQRDGAQVDLERALKLSKTGAMTVAERDTLATRAATTEAEYRAALAAETQATRTVDVARSAKGVRAVIAGRARLFAPIDGLVVRRERDPGAFVQPGVPVLRVIDDAHLRVRAWVDETELGALARDQVTRVVLRSDPSRTFAGRVERIAGEADRQTHEVLVDVRLTELPARFAVGQRADVFVTTEELADTVRVPLGLCSRETASCIVERDGRGARVAIEPGLSGARFLAVRSGLAVGDRVVSAPPSGPELADRALRVAARQP